MKIHPRTMVVQKAEAQIQLAVSKISEEFNLTHGEMVRILSGLLAFEAKYMIRNERHGESETPGDTDSN